VTVGAVDDGLGQKYLALVRQGSGIVQDQHLGCRGDRFSPCPGYQDFAASVNLTEGVNTFEVHAYDAVDLRAPIEPWEVLVDRTAPEEPRLSGPAAGLDGREIAGGSHRLDIAEMYDAEPAPGTVVSGVRSADVMVDGAPSRGLGPADQPGAQDKVRI